MTREEFDATFARLRRSRGPAFMEHRDRLVAAGASIVPWLLAEESSRDVWQALDARIVRMWLEEDRRAILACDGILEASLMSPRTFEEERTRAVMAIGNRITPRLLEGLFRSEEYLGGMQRHRAFLAMRAMQDPAIREPLRAVMGDPGQPLPLRREAAEALDVAFRDPSATSFAEALAWDDAMDADTRAWAVWRLSLARQRHVLPRLRGLLEARAVAPTLRIAVVSALQELRDAESIPYLESIILHQTLEPEVRRSVPDALCAMSGAASLEALRRAAGQDPDEGVRDAAARCVRVLEVGTRP